MNELENVASLGFMQGVFAERMGLVGSLEDFLSPKQMGLIERSMYLLEAFEDWTINLTGQGD